MVREKVLVIGATGYIGSHLYQLYKEKDPDTLGTSYRQNEKFEFCDLYNPSLKFLDHTDVQYSTAIIAAAIPNILKCQEAPKKAFIQNVLGTLSLVHQLTMRGIKPIVFSSDVVFDGSEKVYTEDSPLNPVNEYGNHKKYLEEMIPKICDDYLILRLSKTYSSHIVDTTFLHELTKRLMKDEKMRAASDLIFNPIDLKDVLHAIPLLIEKKCTGLYNLSGVETTSWFHLAQIIAQELGIDIKNIEETSIDEFSPGAKRAKNLNMKPQRILEEFSDFKFSSLKDNIHKITLFNQTIQK